MLRLVFGEPTPVLEPNTGAPVAEHRGINVHAKQCVDGRDRRQLERLCRYITRPPVAQDRLERLADGRLELSFKRPCKDGTRAVVLDPDDLMLRLCAAVPPPRFHLVRYFGVLSSHSSLRKEVVPEPPDDPSAHAPPPAPGDQLELDLDLHEHGDAAPPTRKRWAWLLAHVFATDLDTCPRCKDLDFRSSFFLGARQGHDLPAVVVDAGWRRGGARAIPYELGFQCWGASIAGVS